tara:strand:- start:861 stop:1085 length:225 start_codon:yes stop_codon:yes gene_type:complete
MDKINMVNWQQIVLQTKFKKKKKRTKTLLLAVITSIFLLFFLNASSRAVSVKKDGSHFFTPSVSAASLGGYRNG